MGRERIPCAPMYPKRQNFEPVGDQKITCRPRQGDSIFIGGAFTHRSYIFSNFPKPQTAKMLRIIWGLYHFAAEAGARNLGGFWPAILDNRTSGELVTRLE
jgi:hypothetical protein